MKILILAFGLLATVNGAALSQHQPRLPKLSDYEITKALETQDIANFPLTEAFLSKMEKIQAELVELPIEGEADASGDDLTISGLQQAIKARPLVMAVLDRHDMAVGDYVLGSMALSNALLAAVASESGQEEETLFFDEPVIVSPENLAFGRAYADRIRALHGG